MEKRREEGKVTSLTVGLSLVFVLGLFLFSPLAVKILFNGLTPEQKELTVALLRVSAVSVFLLSFLQTTNGVLIGRGKLYSPVLSLFVGVVIKTILNLILLRNQSLNIFASAIALIACYFSSCLINSILIIFRRVSDGNKEYKGGRKICPQ
jgi:O-antigen/teichoic acid export membrane protein